MDVGRIELVMDPSITTKVLELGPPSFGGRLEEREVEIQSEAMLWAHLEIGIRNRVKE